MSNNNYFTITYKILSYLKHCYEQSKDVDPNILNAGTFNISEKQFIRTLKMLISEGYIEGVSVQETLDGYHILSNLQKSSITPKGLEYLAENSMMKKMYKVLKEVKDWLPIIK